jgi:hypothetical protein
MKYDHYKVIDYKKKITRELSKFSPRKDPIGKAK